MLLNFISNFSLKLACIDVLSCSVGDVALSVLNTELMSSSASVLNLHFFFGSKPESIISDQEHGVIFKNLVSGINS